MATQNWEKLGPVETCDHTTSIEAKFQKQLKWVKSVFFRDFWLDSTVFMV